MTIKHPNYLGMSIVFLLLIGCAAIPASPTAAPGRVNNPTNTMQLTIQRTSVVPDTSITVDLLDLAVQRSKDLLQSPCLPINPHFSPSQEVAQDLFITRENTPYIFDLNNNTQTELQPPAQIARQDYFVSPDGKWVAYQDYLEHEDKNYLLVMPITILRKNLSEPRYEWSQPGPFYVQGWFSENTLLLTRWSGDKEYPTAEVTTVILNPFTREEKAFNLEDYPNYKRHKSGGVGSYLFGHSNLLPDPTLTRMVYPEVIEQMYSITLWDLEQQQSLVKLDFFHEDITNDPLWSRDGKNFLIKNPGLHLGDGIEWFKVTREGNVQQLTHFGRSINKGIYGQSSRSWDGRYLAFKLEYPWDKALENRYSRYFVLDLELPSLEGFCIDAAPFSGGELPVPVWSIDNRYLAISNSNNGLGDLILMDVEKRQVYQIGKDMIARGWVEHP